MFVLLYGIVAAFYIFIGNELYKHGPKLIKIEKKKLFDLDVVVFGQMWWFKTRSYALSLILARFLGAW